MWSENLQQQTRDFLHQYGAAAMKHSGDYGFGVCVVLEGKYIIQDREEGSQKVWRYDTIEALLEDGWAID